MIPSGSASVEMLAIMIPANSSIVGKKTLDSRGGTARRSGKFVGMSSPFKPPRPTGSSEPEIAGLVYFDIRALFIVIVIERI